MNNHIAYETACPNSHNQTIKLTHEEFDAALKSDTLIFHCNTCDTNWTPSGEDLSHIKKLFAKE